MSFESSLRTFRDAAGGNKQLAPAIHERWPTTPTPAISTISSRLSDLVGGESKGVEFFFRDPAVRSLLYAMLAVPEHAQAELTGDAEARLEGDFVRVVVEFSAIDVGSRDAADALFSSLEAELKASPEPVALIITEKQYRWLPRDFEPPKFQVVRVADAAAGGQAAAERSAKGGLLVSPTGRVKPERWVAMEQVQPSVLAFWPEGAIAAYERDGQLRGSRVPEHDLADLGGKPDPDIQTPSGIARRKLFETLGDPSYWADTAAPIRLAYAQQLGIPAAATERERIEANISEIERLLGVTAESVDQATLDVCLARARTRASPPRLLRVDDVLHAINVQDATSGGRLFAHFEVVQRAVIQRLLHVPLCEFGILDDRFLERALQVDEVEQPRLQMARASLLHTGSFSSTIPEPDGAWREALSKLFGGPAPASMMRLDTDRSDHFILTGREWERITETASAENRGLVQVPPAVNDAWVSRLDSVLVQGAWATGHPDPRQPLLLIDPNAWALTGQAEEWLDAVEAEENSQSPSPSSPCLFRSWNFRGQAANRARVLIGEVDDGGVGVTRFTSVSEKLPTPLPPPIRVRPGFLGEKAWVAWNPQAVPIGHDEWRSADRLLAFVWWAVQAALANSVESRGMHDGAAVLPLGGGIFAEIRAWRFGAPDAPVRAGIDGCLASVGRPGSSTAREWRFVSLTSTVEAGSARIPQGALVGPDPAVPRRVSVTGLGWGVTLNLLPSRLLF